MANKAHWELRVPEKDNDAQAVGVHPYHSKRDCIDFLTQMARKKIIRGPTTIVNTKSGKVYPYTIKEKGAMFLIVDAVEAIDSALLTAHLKMEDSTDYCFDEQITPVYAEIDKLKELMTSFDKTTVWI